MKKANQEEIEICIRQQGIKHVEGCIDIGFAWFEPNMKRDKDNVSAFGRKVILDSLVECGVLDGDGWKHVGNISDEFFVDAANPRIEVWIFERRASAWNETAEPTLQDFRGLLLGRKLGL